MVGYSWFLRLIPLTGGRPIVIVPLVGTLDGVAAVAGSCGRGRDRIDFGQWARLHWSHMTNEPLHVVAREDSAEPDEPRTVPPGVLSCRECTILIGPGYLEREPWPHLHGPWIVCNACLESLERRARRGETAPPEPPRGVAGRRYSR